METKAQEALAKNVAKWKKIAAGKAEDRGDLNCTLCDLFLDRTVGTPSCVNCPVALATGQNYCRGTPYREWAEHLRRHHGVKEIPRTVQGKCPECKAAALAFAEFLALVAAGKPITKENHA